MNFSTTDIAHIRTSLIVFLAVLLVGGSSVYLMQNMSDISHQATQTAQKQLAEARNKYNVARDDRDNLSTYATEYDSWTRRKVIGEEQRLDLIEELEALRTRNLVIDFKYTIAPQQGYSPTPALDSGNFELRQSTMSIQLDLLHEGQLINFFNAINASLKGWFILNQCTVSRSVNLNTSAQLKAECRGLWLTIKNRNAR